jgi:hypothetical protein
MARLAGKLSSASEKASRAISLLGGYSTNTLVIRIIIVRLAELGAMQVGESFLVPIRESQRGAGFGNQLARPGP